MQSACALMPAQFKQFLLPAVGQIERAEEVSF
jgi:hypothetical protein